LLGVDFGFEPGKSPSERDRVRRADVGPTGVAKEGPLLSPCGVGEGDADHR
jgi:hypothetical protein